MFWKNAGQIRWLAKFCWPSELRQGFWPGKKQGRQMPGGSRPAVGQPWGEITGSPPQERAGNPLHVQGGGMEACCLPEIPKLLPNPLFARPPGGISSAVPLKGSESES